MNTTWNHKGALEASMTKEMLLLSIDLTCHIESPKYAPKKFKRLLLGILECPSIIEMELRGSKSQGHIRGLQ